MLLISWMIRIFDLATNVKSLYLVLGIHALKILFIIHAIGPVQELFQNSEFWIRSQADSETIERLQSNAGEILARIQHESDFQKSYFRCSRQENDCILQNAHNEPKCVDTMVNTSTKLVAILLARGPLRGAPAISQPILLTYSPLYQHILLRYWPILQQKSEKCLLLQLVPISQQNVLIQCWISTRIHCWTRTWTMQIHSCPWKLPQ